MFNIEFENRCLRELRKLDKKILKKIVEIIETAIAKNPYDAKPLKGPYKGLFSYRYADYRIIYEINENTITIVVLRIGHRKNVYDGL